MKQVVVNCETQEEFDAIVKFHEERGHRWKSHSSVLVTKKTSEYIWCHFAERTCISVSDGVEYGSIRAFQMDPLDNYIIISFKQWLKGE